MIDIFDNCFDPKQIMPFKTNNFTVMEYCNMDLIICVEYENQEDPDDKLLKIVVHREYDSEMMNIFHMKNIPKEVYDIYEYSKTVSKVVKEDDGTYAICGQRINKRDTNYKKILFHNTNPIGKKNTEINPEIWDRADIDCMNQETQKYYDETLKTIKWKLAQ